MRHHLFFTFLIVLLALTACNNDEPNGSTTEPEESTPESYSGVAQIYFSVYGPDCDCVYTINGISVYECPYGNHIQFMDADGLNLYLAIKDPDGNYSIVKNGNVIFHTDYEVLGMKAIKGDIYTLRHKQVEGADDKWSICKNKSVMYELDPGYQYHGMRVKEINGNVNVGLAVKNSDKPYYWLNGQLNEIEGIDQAMGFTTMDFDDNNILVTLGKLGYYESYWLSGHVFYIFSHRSFITKGYLIDHKPVFIGRQYHSFGPSGDRDYPIIISNDEIRILHINDRYGSLNAKEMIQIGQNSFILAHETIQRKWSMFFINEEPVDLGNIDSKATGDSINLSDTFIKTFAVTTNLSD